MAFADLLGHPLARPPLMFEPVPPPKKARPDEVDRHVERLAEALELVPEVAALNIPQIIGGAYETLDALDYAVRIQDATAHEAAVNKIVALTPEDELDTWLGQAHAQGIRHLILVGGESSRIDYPGPSVTRANQLAAHHPDAPATIGNICIPFRRRRGNDEPDRMVEKTQAGARHFTAQIILEPVTTRRLLRDYERACRHAGTAPATVFVGLAPITEPRDLELLKHLGVEVPPHIERELLWDPDEIALRSLELNLGILRNILSALREENIQVPVGLNVEQVSLRNFDASVELAREANLLLEEHTWLVQDAGPITGPERTATSRTFA